MRIPIPIIGPTYKSGSLPLSAQVTCNLYPEIVKEARSIVAFHGTPGSVLRASTNGKRSRGMIEHAGHLYTVSGQELYKIDVDWNVTLIGTISGHGQCEFGSDGSNLLIATGGTPYLYDGTTLQPHPSVNVGQPNSFSFLNQRFWLDGSGGSILLTDLNNPTSIKNSAINPDARAESNSDSLLRIYAFNQTQYLFGSETIEQWWNTGSGNPPIARVNNTVLPIGLGAVHSVSSNDRFVYFLDHKRRPQRLSGIIADPIGNPALGDQWNKYQTFSDAIGNCFSWGHQNFYAISFPSAGKTWVYHEASNSWFEMSRGAQGERHIINDYVWFNNKHIIIDYRNSQVLEWDFNTYTDNGDIIKRQRDSAYMHGGLISQDFIGRELFQSSFSVVMETGVGATTGQGNYPKVALMLSDDNGDSFYDVGFGGVGVLGNRTIKLEWFTLGSFYERIYRLVITDPIKVSILSAHGDIEIGL